MSTDIIYGIHAVKQCLEQNAARIKVVFVQAGREDQRILPLLEMAHSQGIAVQTLSKHKMDGLVKGVHQGIVVQCRLAEAYDESFLHAQLKTLPEQALFLVLDGVTDPHNLGACLRTAEAAGVLAVIAPKDKSAPLSMTVSKVACGAADIVPYVRVTNLARSLRALQDAGVWVVGMAGEAEKTLYETHLNGALALVMGSEGKGLRLLTRQHCDALVKIPMSGEISSLNVSVATGVGLFELIRQRH